MIMIEGLKITQTWMTKKLMMNSILDRFAKSGLSCEDKKDNDKGAIKDKKRADDGWSQLRLCCEDRKEKDRVAIKDKKRADEMMNGPG